MNEQQVINVVHKNTPKKKKRKKRKEKKKKDEKPEGVNWAMELRLKARNRVLEMQEEERICLSVL